MTDLAALARALHVAAVVHWIGGLTFVTFVVLPTLGDQKPETRAAGFAAIERRFAGQARISVALAGVTGYIGFDATAKSLHAGSLIQIMMLHWMQQTGHRPIALMGGGTTMI